jgi:transposase InsO family protein
MASAVAWPLDALAISPTSHSLTRQAKAAPAVPDLLQREFTAEEPDRKWTTDISYVPTAQGWLYLAVIVDLCSRAVVGWAADTHMRTELVLDAFTMALTARRPRPGLIVHSDYAEVSVKPRNGGFACAGGGRWLIPRLNEPLVVAA